jgi:iron complex transport system substrate-binding protein
MPPISLMGRMNLQWKRCIHVRNMTRHQLLLILVLASTVCRGQGVELVDDLGRNVTLPTVAHNVVSLAPSVTESLFAIGAADQIAGVTDYCNFPEAAKHKPHVGGLLNPSLEAIVALRPDLVVVSMEGNLRDDYVRLTSLDIPVFVTNPRTLEGIRRSLRQLGILTGHAAEAESLALSLQRREESLLASVPKTRTKTLLVVSVQPLIVVGTGTFLNELLQRAGAENLGAGTKGTYPTLSRESVLERNPDVILLMGEIVRDPSILTQLFPEWSQLNAIRKHRVHNVNADILSRPGPRAVDGLALLITLLHTQP